MPKKRLSKILKITGLSILFTGMLSAAIPTTPGPYVGVFDVTDTTARISFLDNSTDEDGFKIYIHDSTDVFDATLPVNPILVGPHNSVDPHQYADITGLDAQSFYQLHISAYNADGESAKTVPSSENNGRIKTSPPACQPAMPGEYVGTYNITNTSAKISFIDNSTNEDGFYVYIYDYNTNALINTITLPPKTGTGMYQYADITGLTKDTLYRVAVTAFASGCGESTPTHASSITNGKFRTTNETCPLMPGAYVGTYNVTSNGAKISFIDNADNESGFKIYVYEGSTTNTLVTTITVGSKSGVGQYQYASITGLDANKLYTVRVSAFNNSCESSKTAPSSVTNGRIKTTP